MAIKNYTTTVPAARSIAEVQESLVKHGAKGCMFEYDDQGRIESLKFLLEQEGNRMSFSLPVEWRKFQIVIERDGIKRWEDEEYCYRVAWRCLRDWVLAQMALYETQMVTVPQIFLPFAMTNSGKTLSEVIADKPQDFFLGSGK
jgi:hypothetical protein